MPSSYKTMNRKPMQALPAFILMILVIAALGRNFAGAEEKLTKSPSDLITSYHCTFARDSWKADDWLMVQNPYAPVKATWIQRIDGIANNIPEGMTPTEAMKSRCNDLFASMVLKKKVTEPVTISTVTSFEPQYAPLIVLADNLEEIKPGESVYRKYVEIVIYDKGINFWQHKYEDGKETHEKVAWSNFDLKPDTKYKLDVKVNGRYIEATVDGHHIGWKSPDMPQSFYAGITACEGLNKFYSFDVEPIGKDKK